MIRLAISEEREKVGRIEGRKEKGNWFNQLGHSTYGGGTWVDNGGGRECKKLQKIQTESGFRKDKKAPTPHLIFSACPPIAERGGGGVGDEGEGKKSLFSKQKMKAGNQRVAVWRERIDRNQG